MARAKVRKPSQTKATHVRPSAPKEPGFKKRPKSRVNPDLVRNTKPETILRTQKMREAVALRAAGADYYAIADALGVSYSTARNYVAKAMQDNVREGTEELRTLNIERTNALLLEAWAIATSPDTKVDTKLKAIDTCARRIQELNVMEGVALPQPTVQAGDTTTNVGAIIVVEGQKQDYIESLKQMAGVVDVPTHELPVAHHTNDEPLDIVDAELIEE